MGNIAPSAILCNFTADGGRFLLWKWKLWQVGGGGGVVWDVLRKDISHGEHNPLWLIFTIQRWLHKRKKERSYYENE